MAPDAATELVTARTFPALADPLAMLDAGPGPDWPLALVLAARLDDLDLPALARGCRLLEPGQVKAMGLWPFLARPAGGKRWLWWVPGRYLVDVPPTAVLPPHMKDAAGSGVVRWYATWGDAVADVAGRLE